MILAIVVGGLGLLAGALSAHVAEAVMTERPLARPRCPHCAAPYATAQWSATLALFSGRRRCDQCGRGFRLARLLGELFVALCWGLMVGLNGLDGRVLFSMLAVVPLAMILVTDLEAKRVPNRIILPAIGVMVLLGPMVGPAVPSLTVWTWWTALAGGLVGFLILRALVSVGVAVFGEGAMGEGDITLATYAGLVTGFPLVFVALILGFLLGGVGAAGVLVTRRGSMKTAIPYGPFIILGSAVALLWGPEIVRWFLY